MFYRVEIGQDGKEVKESEHKILHFKTAFPEQQYIFQLIFSHLSPSFSKGEAKCSKQ